MPQLEAAGLGKPGAPRVGSLHCALLQEPVDFVGSNQGRQQPPTQPGHWGHTANAVSGWFGCEQGWTLSKGYQRVAEP